MDSIFRRVESVLSGVGCAACCNSFISPVDSLVSPLLDMGVWREDVFAFSWLDPYAFLPFSEASGAGSDKKVLWCLLYVDCLAMARADCFLLLLGLLVDHSLFITFTSLQQYFTFMRGTLQHLFRRSNFSQETASL